MEYQEFLSYMKKCVADFMGENFRVTINHVIKNNGIVLDGIVIMEKDHNISPTIYMEPFYKSYIDGGDAADIVKEIVRIYETHVPCSRMDVQFFKDIEMVRKKIVYRLVNYEKNEELLMNVPHRRFLDLAVVYHCLVVSEETGNASILVQNDHLKMWGITEEELFAEAEENTGRLLRAEILDMRATMNEILQLDVLRLMKKLKMDAEHGFGRQEQLIEEFSSFLSEMTDNQSTDEMYILTNHLKMNGASCMMYPGVLKEFAEKIDANLYILPSSVHEVLLVPYREEEDAADLNRMVVNSNRKEIDQQDVLSDSIYYYDRNTDEIKKCN